MDFYVYDTDLNIVGIIDNYTSVIWTLRYNDTGDFEMYIKSTREILDVCKIGRYIVRKSDNTVMIIKSVVQDESVENGNYLTVTGVSIESILSQRISWKVTLLQGRAEECAYMLINANCIKPTDPARVIPNLKLSQIKHLIAEITVTEFIGVNVLDAVKQICDAVGYGFRIKFLNGEFVFEIYNGADHSKNQTENPYIIFDNECLSETKYQNDSTNYKNVALIGGGGEGINRVFSEYGTASGINRFETFVNSSETDTEILESEGRDALREYRNVKTLDGELSNYSAYGVNYSLGDIVQIENAGGVSATARVTEIIQSIDDSGIYTIPTFSEWEVN